MRATGVLWGAVARSSFRRYSTYRAATAAGIFTNCVFGCIICFTYIALWKHNPDAGGYDVTDAVTAGENLLAVRVTQWSAHSYLEDQDQWWMSGIFREVSLLHRPDGGIEHVAIDADYDHLTGEGALRVNVRSTAEATTCRVRPDGQRRWSSVWSGASEGVLSADHCEMRTSSSCQTLAPLAQTA